MQTWVVLLTTLLLLKLLTIGESHMLIFFLTGKKGKGGRHMKQVQGNLFSPGKYRLAGSLNVKPSGDLNLRLNAERQSPGPSILPPSFTAPTASTTGFTSGTASGGTLSTVTGPTTGFSTPTGEGGTMAGSNPRQVGLNAHNQYRAVHNAPAMLLTSKLNNDAQQFADKLARESLFKHDPNRGGQGENLGLQCGLGSDAELVKKVVDAWYYEVCKYNFNHGNSVNATGHFTQVVWRESTQLGIGYARGSYSFGSSSFDNCLFVVGRYKEPGNKPGAFKSNVLKGSFNKQASCPPPGNYGKRSELKTCNHEI